MLYQIQDSITELKEQISKKDTETIQAIMQTSLNNVQKEESTDTNMMKMLLPELIKNLGITAKSYADGGNSQ